MQKKESSASVFLAELSTIGPVGPSEAARLERAHNHVSELSDTELEQRIIAWSDQITRYPASQIFLAYYQAACEEQMRRIRERLEENPCDKK
jgi:hypothetical protein